MDVVLASCAALPEPDHDQELLEQALRARGLSAATWAWDGPGRDWAEAGLCVLRSTWNYPRQPERFLDWVGATARATQLWNPPAVVQANLHKSYLLELEKKGVPVVPTRLVRRGSPTSLPEAAAGWRRVVVKPAVSAASLDTIRVEEGGFGEAEGHLRSLLARGDALVQPYLPSVEGEGERALVWIDGVLTHAVRKSPRFTGEHEAVSEARPLTAEERELAGRALAAAPRPLLYARVDVAPDHSGRLVVMELELIEPSLFLLQHPPALERLADAIHRLARGG